MKRTLGTSLPIVLLAAALVASCTSAPTRPSGKGGASHVPGDDASHLTGQESNDYKEIQNLYSRGQYEALIQKLAHYEKKYPRSAQLTQAYNLHGLAYLLTKRPLQAILYFKKSADSSTQASFKQYVLYNLASAQFDANQMDEAQKTVLEIKPDSFDRDTRVKYHSLRARLYQKLDRHLDSARETMTLARMMDETQARAVFAPQLEQSLQALTDVTGLEALYQEFDDAPLADLVLYRLGAQEVAQSKVGLGETHLKLLMSRYPQTSRYADAADVLRSMQNQQVIETNAVGVLLPMKGKFAKYGQRALQAIELAFRIFNHDEPDSRITLVVEDSGDDADGAVRALNNLFFKHHVAATIGPLLSKGVEQVTQRAQELGMPLLTLTQQTGFNGDYIFPSGLTPKVQAQEVARYAIETLGLKRFAILHSRDKFGELYGESFWNAVESLGGRITGIETYTPGETDFRQPIDRLSGLYFTEARQRELDALAKLREEQQIKKRTRRTEQFFALKPIVDYDAVFIPDESRVVGQILPTFAYRDVDKIKFLGIATWNSPELLSRAQSYAEGATFVDAFYPQSESFAVKRFMARFRQTFNAEPTAREALAYDAASLLEQVLADGAAHSRSEIRDRLMRVSGFPGVTGKVSYKDGGFARNLSILTIKSGQFVEVK